MYEHPTFNPAASVFQACAKSPAQAFEQADESAVVVLNHNRPAGYILSPRLMEALLDQAADRLITTKAAERLVSIHTARKISLDDL